MKHGTIALALIFAFVLIFPGFARSSLETRVAAYLRTLVVAKSDTESHEQREVRLKTIAKAVAKHAKNDQEAAALLAIGWHESRWAQYVGDGCVKIPKGSPNCDGGLARSYYQVHGWCRKAWARPRGEGLDEFTECALRHWRYSYKRCKTITGSFSSYRKIGCDWKPAEKRTVTYKQALNALSKG